MATMVAVSSRLDRLTLLGIVRSLGNGPLFATAYITTFADDAGLPTSGTAGANSRSRPAPAPEAVLEFRNDPVAIDSLPAWERLELTPVSPRYAPCRLIGITAWGMVAALAVALFPAMEDVPFVGDVRVAAGVAGATLAAGGLAWLEARRRAWGMREHDLVHRSGIIVRTTVILPFARVQHVETVSGPLERAFGLVRLACYTAGGLSSDLVVAGLDRDTAERVRRYLLGRIRALDEPDHAADD